MKLPVNPFCSACITINRFLRSPKINPCQLLSGGEFFITFLIDISISIFIPVSVPLKPMVTHVSVSCIVLIFLPIFNTWCGTRVHNNVFAVIFIFFYFCDKYFMEQYFFSEIWGLFLKYFFLWKLSFSLLFI